MLIIQPVGGWGLSGRHMGVTAQRSDETIIRRGRGGHVSGPEDEGYQLSVSADMHTVPS